MSDDISEFRSTNFRSLKEIAVVNQDFELAAFLRELGARHGDKSYPMLRELVHRLSETERVTPKGKVRVPIMTAEYREAVVDADYILECEVSDISATYTEYPENSDDGVEIEGAGAKYLEAARCCAHSLKSLTGKLLRAEETIKQLVTDPPVRPVADGLQVPTVDLRVNELYDIIEKHMPFGWGIAMNLQGDTTIRFYGPASDDNIALGDAGLNLSERITNRINYARAEENLPPVEFPVFPVKPAACTHQLGVVYGEYENVKIIFGSVGLLARHVRIARAADPFCKKQTTIMLSEVVGPAALLNGFWESVKSGSVVLEMQPGILEGNNLMLLQDFKVETCSMLATTPDQMSVVHSIYAYSSSLPDSV